MRRACVLLFGLAVLSMGLAAWMEFSPVTGLVGVAIALLPFALADTVRARLLVPRRISALLDRIRVLDESEAPDGEFDEAFLHLHGLAEATPSRSHRSRIVREVLFGVGKSRRWYFEFVRRRREPWAREVVAQIADDWSDPLSERAR